MIWTRVSNLAKPIGAAFVFIALGAMGQSIIDKSTSLPWLHQQAAELHKVQTVDVPKLKSAVGCQARRADEATKMAASPTIQDTADLPVCPPPSAVKNLGK